MQNLFYKKQLVLFKSMLLVMTAGIAACVFSSCSADAPPLSREVELMVAAQVKSLIATDFPGLSAVTIEYTPVTDEVDTIFFETYVKASTVLRRRERRVYQLYANERLSRDRPDDEAVRAILAHELLHLRDYLGKSAWQLLRLKNNYEDENFRRRYERHTDQRTLEMGYGPGLARYRTWLYGVIGDPKKVEDKKRIYMTPQEIGAWLERQQD